LDADIRRHDHDDFDDYVDDAGDVAARCPGLSDDSCAGGWVDDLGGRVVRYFLSLR
jgi:hypothetical protein